PHPEEPRRARRLEGWATSIVFPTLRDGPAGLLRVRLGPYQRPMKAGTSEAGRFLGTLSAWFSGNSRDGVSMTQAKRQLRFGAFFSVPGCHPTGWRHPDAICETDLSMKLLVDMARMAERGKLDCMFFQDSVAIPGSTAVYGGQPFRIKSGRQAHIEPMSAIAAIGAITERIGLISTC